MAKATFDSWLDKHLKETTVKYNKLQKRDRDADYEEIHAMWGYISGLDTVLKQYRKLGPASAPEKTKKKPRK